MSQNPSPSFFKKRKKLDTDENMEIPSLLEESLVKKNIEDIENELSITADTFIHPDVSETILNTAVEMFTFLNFCPPKILKFYEELFRTKSLKEILLALTNIVKVTQNAEKTSSKKILKKTLKSLKLAQFEKIENLANRRGISVLDNNTIIGFTFKIF